jgi:hypothetical protein
MYGTHTKVAEYPFLTYMMQYWLYIADVACQGITVRYASIILISNCAKVCTNLYDDEDEDMMMKVQYSFGKVLLAAI